MVPIADLARDSIAFQVGDATVRHDVHIQRFRSGQVAMLCSCDESSAHGWCRHRVAVLCKRYEAVVGADDEIRKDLDRIIGGTLLAEDAQRLDALLATFDASLAAFDAGRPANIAGDNLATFTELVSDLAAVSADLEDAISRLRRRFEVGNGLVKRSDKEVAELA